MILIIDDDHAVTASLALLLKQAGFASHGCRVARRGDRGAAAAALPAGDPGHELLAPHLGRGGPGAAAADQGADAGAAGGADHGLGLDQPGRRGDEGRRRRLRHQAVDQPADARDGEDDARAGRVAGRRRRPAPTSRDELDARFDFGSLVGRDAEDAARAAADRPRRGDPGVGADHRRERHRQGADRRGAAPQQHRAPTAPSSRSTSAASRRRCSRARCSATSAAPSPTPAPIARAASRWRTAAPSSSTRSATSTRRRR